MDTSPTLLSQQTYARLAGFLYLLVIAVYIAGSFLTGTFHVEGNPGATARLVASNEITYRASLVIQLLSSVMTILLGGAFYGFLRQVDAALALFALLWRVCEAVLGGVTAIFLFVAVKIYAGAPFSTAAQPLLGAVRAGSTASFLISIVYFSVGSTVFFFLLLVSRYVPRWLSMFGLAASVLAWGMAVATLIAPTTMAPFDYAWAPIFVTEVVVGFWLAIRGIAEPKTIP
jgi:hypothetical protein